jgi:hypothetical protein
VLLSAAGGWWAGDQFNWAGGGLRSEHPLGYGQSGSGLYPEMHALFRGALVTVVGLVAWSVGRRSRHKLPTDPGTTLCPTCGKAAWSDAAGCASCKTTFEGPPAPP